MNVASRRDATKGTGRTLEIERVRDSGLGLTREAWGNNSTKYNWRLRKTSAPNWYNNVYDDDWDDAARWIQDNFTGLQGLFALQVLGWVAASDACNYDQERLDPNWVGHEQNLCADGDVTKYLRRIDPSYTVDLLDDWFGGASPKLDKRRFPIWQLDNEPEGWAHTHDDVVPEVMDPEEVVQKYVAVAKEAKARHPELRIMAPGFMEEWHWWTWKHEFVEGLPWAEYFIKRFAEESRRSGVRLLDIVSYHTYVSQQRHKVTDAEVLQEHRMLYDPTYSFPRANGVRKYEAIHGGDPSVERIFARTEEWLERHFGPEHGVRLGITECGYADLDPMVYALWYASLLGTLADHGVELLTVWYWSEQLWEVLHLFARYAGTVRVQTSSSNEELVSAYASTDDAGTCLTVIFVNRSETQTAAVYTALRDFSAESGEHRTLTLANLTYERTFESHSENALVEGRAAVKDDALELELLPYSITAVVVQGRREAR